VSSWHHAATSRGFIGILSKRTFQQFRWLYPETLRELDKFQHLDTPLAGFDLPNKRVRSLQFRSKLTLCQPSSGSRLDQGGY
jgi:hypothetical protein